MRDLLQNVGGLILRPQATLAEIVQSPRIRPVLLLLLVMSAFQILLLAEYLREIGPEGRWFVALVLAAVAFIFVVAFCLEAIAAALTVLTARVVRFPIGWRSVFCLSCFAGIPNWAIPFVSVPLSEWNWEGRWIGHLAIDTIALLWSLRLTFLGLRVLPGSSARRAFVASLPSVLIWYSLTFYFALTPTATLENAEQWQPIDGAAVQVYFSKGNPMPSGLAEKCDQALGWVCKFWNVSTPEQRVRIFLFPSEHSHQRFAQDERSAGSAFPEQMSISLFTGEWDHIAETIAHELSHVVVYHRIARDLPALLDEGMAVMCESEFVNAHGLERSNNPPRLSPGLSLLELADSDVFHGESVETLWVNYPHAGAFVRDLVNQHGADKFKELSCDLLTPRRGMDSGRRGLPARGGVRENIRNSLGRLGE